MVYSCIRVCSRERYKHVEAYEYVTLFACHLDGSLQRVRLRYNESAVGGYNRLDTELGRVGSRWRVIKSTLLRI